MTKTAIINVDIFIEYVLKTDNLKLRALLKFIM